MTTQIQQKLVLKLKALAQLYSNQLLWEPIEQLTPIHEDVYSLRLTIGNQHTLFRQSNTNFYAPIYIRIENQRKLLNNTTTNLNQISRHFCYHWITDFQEISTEAQIKEAIRDPTTCASLTTTFALNKFIQRNTLTELQVKQLTKGSCWRWTKYPNGEYYQQTFYPEYANGGIILTEENRTIFATNQITSIKPFKDWLAKEIATQIEIARNTPRKLLNHSAKATDTFTFKFEPKTKTTKIPLFMGIELELEGFSDKEYKTLDTLKDHAIFKTDGSLTQGVEICSAPATIDIHKKEFSNFFENIVTNNSKLKTSSNCGLHIHVDKKTISTLHLANLYLLINNSNNKNQIREIAGREANRFCEKHEVSYEHFTGDYKERATKYRQVNLAPRDTIELRLFASTTKQQDFNKRLEFAQAIVDYTRPGEIGITIGQIPVWKNFNDYVLSHFKNYPELAKSFGYIPKKSTYALSKYL